MSNVGSADGAAPITARPSAPNRRPALRSATRAVESAGFWSSRCEEIPEYAVRRVQHRKRRAAWGIGLGEIGSHQARGARLLPGRERNDHHDGIERPDRLYAQQLE